VISTADWCGVLLAGGNATRFGGGPKGLQAFSGRRLADAALDALSSTCGEVIIATNAADAASWFPPHRVVRDSGDARGGLAALHTALTAAAPRNVLVCAWDMPFVHTTLLRALQQMVSDGASAAVPTHADGVREPLCAAYSASLMQHATCLMQAGVRAAYRLTADRPETAWAINEHLSSSDAARIFLSVNTPNDLAHASQWIHTQS
jgi:molybdenum cofactor guanylyltransferase